jgi:hypothetical protein
VDAWWFNFYNNKVKGPPAWRHPVNKTQCGSELHWFHNIGRAVQSHVSSWKISPN